MKVLKLVWWVFILVGSLNLLWFIYGESIKQMVDTFKPLTRTETQYQIKYIDIADISNLQMGQKIRYGSIDMCISSIQTENLKNSRSDKIGAPVVINFRLAGDCI